MLTPVASSTKAGLKACTTTVAGVVVVVQAFRPALARTPSARFRTRAFRRAPEWAARRAFPAGFADNRRGAFDCVRPAEVLAAEPNSVIRFVGRRLRRVLSR